MKKIELLAPAKNLETAINAIDCGADAVYIGAWGFGARVNAKNSLSDIEKLVNYAHKFYVRIHVTINTILKDAELEEAIDLIKDLYNIGVDAIIVQDMGIIEAAIEGKIPPIEIHASTQCNNRTLKKVKFFDKLGITRVILARELSLEQIKEICDNVDCEIETFIHGALCVSYSGQCYLSYANGKRSANRGECAQPCRKKYSLIDQDGNYILKNKYLLSLKDFNASEHIEKLIESGVKSFKIEGRLKDSDYVKNVVLFYNNLINNYAKRTSSGKVFTNLEPNLNKTFNRLYTDYFLNGRGECYNFLTPKSLGEEIGKVTKVWNNFLKVSTKEPIHVQDGLCYFAKNSEFSGFLVNRVEKDLIFPNKMPNQIKVGDRIFRNYDNEFIKRIQTSEIKRKIGVKFEIFEDKITVTDEDSNKVSIKIPNGDCPKNMEKTLENYKKQFEKLGKSDYYIMDLEIKANKLVFLPISKINELRRNLLENLTQERIRNYKRKIQQPLTYTKYPDEEIDYRGNVSNQKSKDFYESCESRIIEGAYEFNKKALRGIELMRTKHCLRYALGFCTKEKKDNRRFYLIDENGKKYPLKFDCKNCEMAILG